MFHLAAFLGIGTNLAHEIVNIIQYVGWAGVIFSIVSTILSGGALAIFDGSMDYIIWMVEYYVKRNAKARAVIW